ncbi:MAG: glycosyltransferase family 2 protein [Bacteroidales bacterium]|nr:glycosyltransferase family 2 protein [Bacteroidales bacterium]
MYNYKVSIIIPTFKPGKYIYKCLDSLFKQTLLKELYEIIIILNGCDEPYYTLLSKIIAEYKDYTVNIIKVSEGGVSNARNVGIKNSLGEYICFIDDDDYVSENYIEELLIHASNDTIPVCRPLEFIDETDIYREYSITKDFDRNYTKIKVKPYCAKRFFNGPVYKLIHRDIISNRLFDNRFKNGEDSLFMFLISDKIKYVEFTDKTAIYYRRIRSGSATQSQRSIIYRIRNYVHLMAIVSKIYFSNIRHYNFYMFIISITGKIKSIILD